MNRWLNSQWRRILSVFALGEDQAVRAEEVQKAIVKAITASGVRLMDESVIAFGSRMVVSVSPAAHETIRPVQRRVVAGIENNLPRKLKEAGWILSEQELRLEIVADPDLVGYQVELAASDLDVTPGFPASTTSVRGGSDPQVSIHRLRADGDEWILEPGRTYLVGRPGAGNAISLDNPYVSGVHASVAVKVSPDGAIQGVAVEDLDSTHGTVIGSRTARRGVPVLAQHGDVINLAKAAGESLRVIIGEGHNDATQRWPGA